MTMPPPKSKTFKLPRYLRWRDGRPRWEPGGMARKTIEEAGFKARNLKAGDGKWLTLEAAIAEADRLNAALDAWRAGEDLSPSGVPAPPSRSNALLVDHMIRAHLAGEHLRGLSPNTQKVYAKWARVLTTWIGAEPAHAVTPRAGLVLFQRFLDVYHWKTERWALGERAKNWHAAFLDRHPAVDLRDAVRDRRLLAMDVSQDGQPHGYTMSYQVIKYASAMWTWARLHMDGPEVNPFRELGLASPHGRVRFVSPQEAAAFQWACDVEMQRPELFDAFLLGLHTAQRRGDICEMEWTRLRQTGRFTFQQRKTEAPIDMRPTKPLQRRLDQIWARQIQNNTAGHNRLIVSTQTGQPFEDPDVLSRLIAQARAIAAKRLESCADIVLHDTRDTAITRLFMAGNDIIRVTQISGHSVKQAELIRKAYLSAQPEIADQAIDGYDDWLTSTGTLY